MPNLNLLSDACYPLATAFTSLESGHDGILIAICVQSTALNYILLSQRQH